MLRYGKDDCHMILQISQIDRTAEINIEPVTQLCGQNIVWKNQILRIIKKYFSGEIGRASCRERV